jgi:DNA (cytosine-5)-methyltransferase 1
MINSKKRPSNTFVKNLKYQIAIMQKQSYITDSKFPYYIIYRNDEFDSVAEKLEFDVFDVFRDRQITKKNTTYEPGTNKIRVIKGRNILDNGEVVSIIGYDMYIDYSENNKISSFKYLNDDSVFLTPNMTYKPRVIRNIKNVVADGSIAVLIPKDNRNISDEQLKYFSTDEYRKFYFVARNMSTQSINVDKTSVFFYGVRKND